MSTVTLLDRAREVADRLGGPLRREDRPLWAAAQTRQDLAELTAQWLEGRIESQPGYYGRCDVDKAPDLREALIALNRAGFLTNDSQEGFDGAGYDGAHWRQHAAVTGFCDGAVLEWLDEALPERCEMVEHLGTAGRDDYADAVTVTSREDRPMTGYGAHLSEDTVRGELYDGAGRAAVDDVCDGWQVTLYDPIPGSNEMWPALRQAADQRLAETRAVAEPSSGTDADGW